MTVLVVKVRMITRASPTYCPVREYCGPDDLQAALVSKDWLGVAPFPYLPSHTAGHSQNISHGYIL